MIIIEVIYFIEYFNVWDTSLNSFKFFVFEFFEYGWESYLCI